MPVDRLAVLAQNLRVMRRNMNMTQAELVERLEPHGVTWDRTAVSRVESGQRRIRDDEIPALIDILGSEFLDDAQPGATVTTSAPVADSGIVPQEFLATLQGIHAALERIAAALEH